jgi:hypothetical protein
LFIALEYGFDPAGMTWKEIRSRVQGAMQRDLQKEIEKNARCPKGYYAEGDFCVARCPSGYRRDGGYCVRR